MPSEPDHPRERDEPDRQFTYPDDLYAGEADDDARVLARRLFQGAVAVAAVALFLGVVWYAYTWGGETASTQGELPVVRAEDGPEKERPEDPGGMDVPHQDTLVMNERDDTGDEQVEQLLPPPETPQPPEPEQESQSSTSADAGDGGAAQTDPDGDTQDAAQSAPSAEDAPEDDSVEGGAGEEAQVVEELPETTPDDGDGKAAAESDTSGEPATKQTSEPAKTQTSNAKTTQSEGAATTSTKPAAGGAYAIQLSALREKASAETAWAQLQDRYPDLLGGRELLLQSAKIEGKGTFWRVRTGPFADKAAANAVCGKLKARGQDCLAVSR